MERTLYSFRSKNDSVCGLNWTLFELTGEFANSPALIGTNCLTSWQLARRH